MRYRVESHSKPGEFYEIAVDGADLVCACKGFEYRGTCSHVHVRALKAALAEGGPLPDEVTRVEG